MDYSPKKASWLKVIEIEFSALSEQCLDRRIGEISKLREETLIWARKRTKAKVKG
ncbi:MAG: hypothetical protein H6625_09600 [Bdellovibrionaceae bacterium]|nr:hypothetical protein [Pseudobdellovibrionaceae bacterium]